MLLHTCGSPDPVDNLWETRRGLWKSRSAGPRPPHDLHGLSAVPRDLDLAELRDPILGPALPADEEHIEVLHVLGVLGTKTSGGTPERAHHGETDLRDQDGHQHGDQHDEPPGHVGHANSGSTERPTR